MVALKAYDCHLIYDTPSTNDFLEICHFFSSIMYRLATINRIQNIKPTCYLRVQEIIILIYKSQFWISMQSNSGLSYMYRYDQSSKSIFEKFLPCPSIDICNIPLK